MPYIVCWFTKLFRVPSKFQGPNLIKIKVYKRFSEFGDVESHSATTRFSYPRRSSSEKFLPPKATNVCGKMMFLYAALWSSRGNTLNNYIFLYVLGAHIEIINRPPSIWSVVCVILPAWNTTLFGQGSNWDSFFAEMGRGASIQLSF